MTFDELWIIWDKVINRNNTLLSNFCDHMRDFLMSNTGNKETTDPFMSIPPSWMFWCRKLGGRSENLWPHWREGITRSSNCLLFQEKWITWTHLIILFLPDAPNHNNNFWSSILELINTYCNILFAHLPTDTIVVKSNRVMASSLTATHTGVGGPSGEGVAAGNSVAPK